MLPLQPVRHPKMQAHALLDVVTQMPTHIWYEKHGQANDQSFWPWIMSVVSAGCLLLLDMGLHNFEMFDQLTGQEVGLVTRPKSNTKMKEVAVLSKTAQIHDTIVMPGNGPKQCRHQMRKDISLEMVFGVCIISPKRDTKARQMTRLNISLVRPKLCR